MKFVNQPTAVEVHFDAGGAVRPRRFTWQGAWQEVTDVGRQWTDAAGRHVLVMTAGQQTFELLLARESLTWRVARASATSTRA